MVRVSRVILGSGLELGLGLGLRLGGKCPRGNCSKLAKVTRNMCSHVTLQTHASHPF